MRTTFKADHQFFEFSITDPKARDIFAARTGLELPWWGRRNVGPTRDELDAEAKAEA